MAGLPYPVHEIEERWRTEWEARGVGRVDLDDPALTKAEVFYNLVEFPYPSAEGLHVGHVFRYGGADAYGRYQRMRGKRVFQPMGLDAFGINAENYALKEGRHPKAHTQLTGERFRAQLSRIGCAWDWTHTVDTSDPDYYRWTQWILVKLFEAGLMYRAEAPVIWCLSCLTVLAREQTEGEAGSERCERCSSRVVEKVMTQWFLRTTAYRDRLLSGLDALDWPERAKKLQRHWLDGLRDWLISRQRYWGPPIPIVHCSNGCGAVAVPEEQLPIELPDVDDVRPTDTGISPLAACEEWVRTACPSCGGPARRETDVSDTFVDSSWYFLRYPSCDIDDRPWSDDRTLRTCPVDFYAGGPEHVQRHHLYARFVTMALHDLGLVPFDEPFPKVRLGGFIVHAGAKMSKSRGNVVTPDERIAAHGVDVLRCALLFSTPWDHDGEFTDAAVAGVQRFFGKVWRAVLAADGEAGDDLPPRVVEAVTNAIERLRFNVGIARLMEAVPSIGSTASAKTFVQLLAPFAPHLAEELWHRSGDGVNGSVHESAWPQFVVTQRKHNEPQLGHAAADP
ncbi:MAG TPA: class I tRNA ligase family protein [Acidimicrobiales bacterium]|nr:class I tRNA ligase family protein [Acidimicrobiales bacterium]